MLAWTRRIEDRFCTPGYHRRVVGADTNGSREIAFEAFGVRVLVTTNVPEAIERMPAALPPGWEPCPASPVDTHFEVVPGTTGMYDLNRDGSVLGERLDLDLVLGLLEGQMRAYIALHAPDNIFVHAGVVAHRGNAIVIPGRSFSGKTTLVAALVGAGATYFSDEFAVLDADGLVHPYPKPLSLRDEGQIQSDHHVESLGGAVGEAPVPIGAVVVATYRREASWQPRRLSAGEGAMALLSHTVPAHSKPAETMRALSRAAEGAVVIESERGEADAVVPLLLAELEP
jgi:hypothetical protein